MRRLSILVTLFVLLATSVGGAIEFKPYPVARITESQWANYYEQVKAAHGTSIQEFPQERLVAFHDAASQVSYAFTQPGHAAHPAWIARRPVRTGNDIHIEQIGYFAGQEPPFAVLYQQYQALNEKIREQLRQQPKPR